MGKTASQMMKNVVLSIQNMCSTGHELRGGKGVEMKVSELIAAYRQLIAKLDVQWHALSTLYSSELACGKGCSSCCDDIAVRPIEAYILSIQAGMDVRVCGDSREGCVFLHGGACNVYANRPAICRVHGLPLSYATETSFDESPERVLTWCDMNFTGKAPDPLGKVIDMTEINREIDLLNGKFLQTSEGARYREKNWIHLSELMDMA